VKEKFDLTALARLRWIERWKVARLAEDFEVSAIAIKERLRVIKKNPSRSGFVSPPPKVRGR
jgi:hypothetical protein